MRAQAPTSLRRLPQSSRRFERALTTGMPSTPMLRCRQRRSLPLLSGASRSSPLLASPRSRAIVRATVDGKEEGGEEASTSTTTTTTTTTASPSSSSPDDNDEEIKPEGAAFANLVICAAISTALGAATGVDPWATLFPSGGGDAAAATAETLRALAWGAAASPFYVAFLLSARGLCGGGTWWSEVEGRGDLAGLEWPGAAAWAWALAVADGVSVRGLALGWLSRLTTSPAGVDLADVARRASTDEALLRPLSDAELLASSSASSLSHSASSFFGALLSSASGGASAAAAAAAASTPAEGALLAAGIGGAPVAPFPMPASWFWPFLSLATGAIAAAASCYEPPPGLRAGFEVADSEDVEQGTKTTTVTPVVEIGIAAANETLTMRELLWSYWRDEPSGAAAADGGGGGGEKKGVDGGSTAAAAATATAPPPPPPTTGGADPKTDDGEKKEKRRSWLGDLMSTDYREGRTTDADVEEAAAATAKLLGFLGFGGEELERKLSDAKSMVKTGYILDDGDGGKEGGGGGKGKGKEREPPPPTSSAAAKSGAEASSPSSPDADNEKKSLLGSFVNQGYRDGVISDSTVEGGQRALEKAARALAPLLGVKEGDEQFERDIEKAKEDYARVVKTGFYPGEGPEEGKKEKEEKKTESAATAAASTSAKVASEASSSPSEPSKTTTTSNISSQGTTRVARAARWPATDGPLRSLVVPALVAAEASGLAALTLLTHSLLASTVAHAIGLFALCLVEKSEAKGRKRGDGEVSLR